MNELHAGEEKDKKEERKENVKKERNIKGEITKKIKKACKI
jgi:uncharacterized membrane protein